MIKRTLATATGVLLVALAALVVHGFLRKPGSAEASEPRARASAKTSARVSREYPAPHLISALKWETRPFPIELDDAIRRANQGIQESSNYGYGFEPKPILSQREAFEHLMRNASFTGDTRLSYSLELDEWFAFSCFVGIEDPEIDQRVHLNVFRYGWAVRKSDGQIVMWKEPEADKQ